MGESRSGAPSLVSLAPKGRRPQGERYLPEKAIKSLTSAEYARTTAAKRKATSAGKQVSKQPKSIAKKTRKYRT